MIPPINIHTLLTSISNPASVSQQTSTTYSERISIVYRSTQTPANKFRYSLINSFAFTLAWALKMRPPRIKMKTSNIILCVAVLLLTSSPGVDAFWRLLCHGTLGTARIDPIVSHGEIAAHAHMIAGASSKSNPAQLLHLSTANGHQISASSLTLQTSWHPTAPLAKLQKTILPTGPLLYTFSMTMARMSWFQQLGA